MRTLLLVVLFLSVFPMAADSRDYQAEIGSCRKAKNEREAKRAPHLFFTITEGKELWTELKLLRKDSKKLQLIDGKLKLQLNIERWWKLQMVAAEKTVKAQKEQAKQLNLKIQRQDKKLDALAADMRKWNLEAVKYKGQRYQFLVWGVVGGVVVTGAVVAIVSILVFGGSK